MQKILTSIAVAGLIAVSLVGCSTGAEPSCKATPSGTSSVKIKATGKIGTAPKVTVPSPLEATKTERSVLVAGTGKVAEPGMTASVDYSVYNATTGKQVAASPYTAKGSQEFPIDSTKLLPGIVKALQCSTVGSRIAAVIPPADAFGSAGIPDSGIGGTDSVVFVIDVMGVAPAKKVVPPLTKADGAAQPAKAGFPTVTLAADGAPTMTIPDAAPPTKLEIEVLKKGTGAVVPKAADVIVQYVGMNWNTKKVFDQSWGSSTGAAHFNTGQVIPGFGAAIEGQKVGSQVVVIIPPAEGYGPQGGNGPDIGATDTIAFVIDILGID